MTAEFLAIIGGQTFPTSAAVVEYYERNGIPNNVRFIRIEQEAPNEAPNIERDA